MVGGPFRIIKVLFLVAFASLIVGFVAMLLWNALIPDLFHGPQITYWQAAGLFILSRIMLGSLGGGGRRHKWKHNRWQHYGPGGENPWKKGEYGKGKWTWTWAEGEGEETARE